MVNCLMTHKFTHKSDRNFFLTIFQEKNDTFSRSRYQRSPGTLRSFDQRIIFNEYFCEIEKIKKKCFQNSSNFYVQETGLFSTFYFLLLFYLNLISRFFLLVSFLFYFPFFQLKKTPKSTFLQITVREREISNIFSIYFFDIFIYLSIYPSN